MTCDTYKCDYAALFGFYLIVFQLDKQISLLNFAFLTEIPERYSKICFLRKFFLKEQKAIAFFPKIIGLNSSFTLIENNFKFWR